MGTSDPTPPARTRRTLLAVAATAAAGATAAVLRPRRAFAADVVLDVNNNGTGRTTFISSTTTLADPLRATLLAINTGSTGSFLEFRVGLHGVVNPDNVAGVPAAPTGVMGESNVENGTGMLGVAQKDGSIGVHGRGRAIGVLAETVGDEGIALEVRGTASAARFSGPSGGAPAFSTGGSARIARNQASKKVTNAAVTPQSKVLVTLQSNPGNATVKYVQPAAGSFTVFLTGAVASPTQFAYLVLA